MRPCTTVLFLTSFALALPSLASAQPYLNVVHPLPPQSPPWLEGFQVRWPVRILGEPSQQPTSQTVLVRIPTGGWLKPDGSDLAVQSGSGKLLPSIVQSYDPGGETIIQFLRNGNDPWYWVYGVSAKGSGPKADVKTNLAFREGVTLELRDWVGDDLSSWVKVRAGLEKSTKIIGNAIVTEVMQNCNPARPDDSTKFAASYRGFFNVKKDGTYNFVVNADDAAFLFIDGFKVFERPGVNRTLGTVKIKELEKIAGKVELKAGVHAFEIHQAVGDTPQSAGRCALTWTTPDQPKFSFMPQTAVAHPLYARAAVAELASGDPAGTFAHGNDDALESSGLKLFLVRFEADVADKDAGKLQWDFGDGNTAVGRSVVHIYFKEGDYQVTLKSASSGLPPFRRTIRVWPEPGDSSPLSLELAVQVLSNMEWKKLDMGKLRQIFAFLQICEQPNRWPLLDAVTEHLLAQKDFDPEMRNQLITTRMETLTELKRAPEAIKLAEQAKADFAKFPVLQVRLQLAVAAIYQYHYKDPAVASKIYEAILEEHKRVEHPNLRLAGVRWGDLFAEKGDLVRAGDTYRFAATLGGEKFNGTAQTEASTRGALMRIAEQKLKSGENQAARQLLERIELEFPGRRLDGLYCYLRAESDRQAGRYEDALRHYMMIFKLPQWAGYRDRAGWGVADVYYRMGDLEKAAKYFQEVKEEFPKYFEAQKGPAIAEIINDRLARVKEATAEGKPETAFFRGFATGFEPDEKEWFGASNGFAVVRAPGMQGPHAALMDIYPRDIVGPLDHVRPLKNLTPGSTYWAEIWYRDEVRPAPPAPHQYAFIHLYLSVEPPAKAADVLASASLQRNSHHQWHKLSFPLKTPLAQDFKLKFMFYNQTGAILYDRLSIRPVSDRQLDALVRFLEGGKAP